MPDMKKKGKRDGMIIPAQISSALFTAFDALSGLDTSRHSISAVRLMLTKRTILFFMLRPPLS